VCVLCKSIYGENEIVRSVTVVVKSVYVWTHLGLLARGIRTSDPQLNYIDECQTPMWAIRRRVYVTLGSDTWSICWYDR
jgi:hypothetical protein